MDAIYQSYPGKKRRKQRFFAVLGILLLMLNITMLNPSVLAAEPESEETTGDYGTKGNETMMDDSDIQENGATEDYHDALSAVEAESEKMSAQTDSSPDSQETAENVETVSGNNEPLSMDAKEGETEVPSTAQPDEEGKTEIQPDEEERTAIQSSLQPDEDEVTDVILPNQIEVAFNPLGLAVNMGDDSYSTNQVISRNYEIQNKGSTDQIVEIAIIVEDLNGGQILFVDSPETVEAAEEGAYAVYLAMVLSADVPEAEQGAIPLYSGENKIAFRLSGGTQRTFAFGGAMNERADWSKLSEGVRFSVAYTYKDAKEDETDSEAAGSMMETEKENVDLNTAEAVHGL